VVLGVGTDSKSQQRSKEEQHNGMQWDTVIQQRSIVAMIGSDAKNRFRNIVSSEVVDEWGEYEHSRSL
jgi:hypothetical protein